MSVMKFSAAKAKLPSLVNSLLALLSAILLTLSFPDFDLWFLAWFALVPLFFAIEREKESVVKSFVLGWIFGICFFFGTCWWLTFAPITYGGVPSVIAYALLFGVTLLVGLFPAIFSAIFSLLLKRLGTSAIFAAPFLWTTTEFLRFNLTGNNWNAIGYSQAFTNDLIQTAQLGGVYLTGFCIYIFNSIFTIICFSIIPKLTSKTSQFRNSDYAKSSIFFSLLISLFVIPFAFFPNFNFSDSPSEKNESVIVAVQPNVPMSGLKYGEWEKLRQRHVELAENALSKQQTSKDKGQTTIIIFPESPMNFLYESDREFQTFIRDFAVKNNAFVLFNSAQPNLKGTNLYNSAVMVNPKGEKIGQYDKIHLVPFGEYVPLPEPIAAVVPTMVGNFEIGDEFDLLPFGEAKGGVMICFESHFASLSREFVRNGADVLIEMTNDGYLGDTPVLRQHLANAVFRAVETNRPVLRITNVGITAYINKRGEISDATKPYT
ncbi:MAG: apolipoprotein N-acyltransferase, partial [Acidobacteriota bacterium]|nr:apolipoprotein N-acyltransferase [Acidobacteriota bacterium]